MERRKLSLCIITFNEEDNLPRCLRSAAFADEVVVLDSGSTDRTCELAREAGARVFIEEFRGHVDQKARALELARHDWVLSLDADEELSPELALEVQAALESQEADVSGYRLPRKTCYLGRFINHSGWWPEYRLRLFDRRNGQWAGRDPHDRFDIQSGEVKDLNAPLFHYNYRDLFHHLEKVNAYTTIMAREMARDGCRFRLHDALLRPPGRFLRMYVLRQGFRDGWRGFVLAVVGAFYVFLKYVKLWEFTHTDPGGDGSPPGSISSSG